MVQDTLGDVSQFVQLVFFQGNHTNRQQRDPLKVGAGKVLEVFAHVETISRHVVFARRAMEIRRNRAAKDTDFSPLANCVPQRDAIQADHPEAPPLEAVTEFKIDLVDEQRFVVAAHRLEVRQANQRAGTDRPVALLLINGCIQTSPMEIRGDDGNGRIRRYPCTACKELRELVVVPCAVLVHGQDPVGAVLHRKETSKIQGPGNPGVFPGFNVFGFQPFKKPPMAAARIIDYDHPVDPGRVCGEVFYIDAGRLEPGRDRNYLHARIIASCVESIPLTNQSPKPSMFTRAKALIKPLIPAELREVALRLRYRDMRLPRADRYQVATANRIGIEVGGPSFLFKTALPVYHGARRVDGVNFSTTTLWEGSIQPGTSYRYFGARAGIQYISEASDLSSIDAGSYDFLLSSNCLEHVANPLRAMAEWNRVLKPGGCMILVLPNKRANFDHRRPFTTFEHLLEDFACGTAEDDLTHLDEILALHDLSRDPGAGDHEAFRRRSICNHANRALHHHVFNREVAEKALRHSDFDVLEHDATDNDFIWLARKPAAVS